MYNPSRGGVRGGADQFTWESVKNDKHRENYLGHSLKAPVGRWQKGKDLSWYAKERNDTDGVVITEKSELSAIKRAEEEAMLIALGHNIVRKESQTLTKEEMKEALKRNVGDRDELNIERVDGLGASSRRAAMLSGAVKDTKNKSEGVAFESHQSRTDVKCATEKQEFDSNKKKKSKKTKKHKKEKKHKKHVKDSPVYGESDNSTKHRTKHKNMADYDCDVSDRSHPKTAKRKKSKHKHRHHHSDSSISESGSQSSSRNQKRKSHGDSSSNKRHRHDTSESD